MPAKPDKHPWVIRHTYKGKRIRVYFSSKTQAAWYKKNLNMKAKIYRNV